MPSSCCAPGCTRRLVKGTNDVKMFRLPMSDPERLTKWIVKIGRLPAPGSKSERPDGLWQPKDHDRVCNMHFVTEPIDLTACKFLSDIDTGIPLFLSHDSGHSHGGTPTTTPESPIFSVGRKKRAVPSIIPSYVTNAILSLEFLLSQRSGSVVWSSPFNTWHTSSGMFVKTPDGRDLTGGFYNGNDNVKLTFTMAFTSTTLTRSYMTWMDIYMSDSTLIENYLSVHLHFMEYFQQVWDEKNQRLYVQVGDFGRDRTLWETASSPIYEQMFESNQWPIHSVTSDRPGSDVAAQLASHYALAATLYSEPEEEYNAEMVSTAKQLYHFAVTYRGKYTDHIPVNTKDFPVYESTGYTDELCVAAIDIYLVTKEERFLNDAMQFFDSKDETYLYDWDQKTPLCALQLYKATRASQYKEYLQKLFYFWLDIPMTKSGLTIHPTGTLSQTANIVMLAVEALKQDVFSDIYFTYALKVWAFKQINYMLGFNEKKFSFFTYNNFDFPKNTFHKNSACPNGTSCGWKQYSSPDPNAHTLIGALVGGPDLQDNYEDTRTNTRGNSVTIEYNAGFHGALVGLRVLFLEAQEECRNTATTTWTESPAPTLTPIVVSTGRTKAVTNPTTPFKAFTSPLPTEQPTIPTEFEYSDALGKSIQFYLGQTDTRNISYSGGWYDDGSDMKTTLVMAHVTTILGWGGVTFRSGYVMAGQWAEFLRSLREPLSYLMTLWDSRAMDLVRKVGTEGIVRAFWSRPGVSADPLLSKPYFMSDAVDFGIPTGEDILGEVATAFTIASLLYREEDPDLSSRLLADAEQLYDQMDAYSGGSYFDAESKHYAHVSDSTDERCLASVWLFRATDNPRYLSEAMKYPEVNVDATNRMFGESQSMQMSYHNKHVLCQLLLYQVTGLPVYMNAVYRFLKYWSEGGVESTPQGLAYGSTNGPLRYTANAAFVAMLAAELDMNPVALRSWSKSQIDYMLGHNSNAYSYQIGYGDKYPKRPHHRRSSCPDDVKLCTWSVYNSPWPNPHPLTGALVAGPDITDFHEDCRSNITMNRVAIDYNAGFQSTLAAMAKYFTPMNDVATRPPEKSTTVLPRTKPRDPEPTTSDAELSTNITSKTSTKPVTRAKTEATTTKPMTMPTPAIVIKPTPRPSTTMAGKTNFWEKPTSERLPQTTAPRLLNATENDRVNGAKGRYNTATVVWVLLIVLCASFY